MWPEVSVKEARGWAYLRMRGGVGSSILFGLMLSLAPARAYGQGSSSLMAGTGQMNHPAVRQLFPRLRRTPGGFARLPLSEGGSFHAQRDPPEILRRPPPRACTPVRPPH